MPKQYTISDLFITAWQDQDKKPTLNPEHMAIVLELRHKLDQAIAENNHDLAGMFSIQMLRILRRDKSAVSKINIEQAVDCINDINFFREPWYFFPAGSKGIFHEPDEYMHDRNFEQLCYADSAFTKFLILEKAKDPSSMRELDELIAILYTKPDEFKVEFIGDRTNLVKQLRDHEKALILHTYVNIREYIVERFPNLFPKPPEDSGDNPEVQKLDYNIVHTGPMWRKLLYNFAETEAFKGYDNARTARVYEALEYLELKTIEAAELSRKANAKS